MNRTGLRALVACVALALLAPVTTSATPPEPGAVVDEGPPTWRFRALDKPVKVVILAGSVGEWKRDPYASHFANWCSNIEVKNLSKTGAGAWELRQIFMKQLVANAYVNLRAPEYEYWLVFQGGLNSVATPEKTNKEIRQLLVAAHQRGMKVVVLSLMPWGDESDGRRWRGLAGLAYKRFTETIVDYELGRLTPREALGRYVDSRDDPDAPWDPSELADVGVNLHDSPMRDREAKPRDVAAMRKLLLADKDWQKRLAGLDETTRELGLDEQAQRAAELPQWFMREELRAFDHIHPNEHGHRLIAEVACPQLPASWGCSCPSAGE